MKQNLAPQNSEQRFNSCLSHYFDSFNDFGGYV